MRTRRDPERGAAGPLRAGGLVALAALGGTAAAACPDGMPAADARDLVPGLLGWIAAHAPYRVDGEALPAVLLCRSGDAIAYEGRDLVVGPLVHGLYDHPERQIWLVAPWDAGDPVAVSTLLHELVHHLQFTQARWPCAAAAEPEAYRLQAAWLAEQGIEAGFDWGRIALASRCPFDVHP